MWISPLYNKSEVFSKFLKFYEFFHNQFNAHIKCFQSDGDEEYRSKVFIDFLESKGIVHQFSCPYTFQQNGLAERKNQHLIETTITLLTATSLPGRFWFHFITHVAYLINRMPSVQLNNHSPYFKFFGKHPEISTLRVFGTAIFPYTRPYNIHKLHPQTI